MSGILLVEDEVGFRDLLHRKLQERGFRVESTGSIEKARDLLKERNYEVVLLDIRLSDGDGLNILREFSSAVSSKFIVITGFGDVQTAVEAMKAGATDFLQKPFSFEILEVSIKKAIKEKRLEEENKALRNFLFEREGDIFLESRSERFLQVLELVNKSSQTDMNILLRGETGTGKEVLARYIHRMSPRREKPFIVVDCGAIPEHLFESELFGHEKGAYTGATNRKIGLVELADGGTLFLDEIGEVPKSVQPKLLRFVETRKLRRVGGLKEISVDVRIISATNRDLEEMVRKGEFRSDLLYRINTLEISLPPLRERKEDIEPLVMFFLKRYRKKLSQRAMRELVSYSWPGNIRELKNAIERACLLARGEFVDDFLCLPRTSNNRKHEGVSEIFDSLPSLKELEGLYVRYLYDRFGNVSKVAQVLGCSRRTVFRKLRELRDGKVNPKCGSLSGSAEDVN